MDVQSILSTLSARPSQHPDCCCSLSIDLLDCLLSHVPKSPSIILSCGAGTGLLERLLLERSQRQVNIYGIEVPSCVNKYLSAERMLRVRSTTDLHSEALLADALIFCYPRPETLLLQKYLANFVSGTLHTAIVLTHYDDHLGAKAILMTFFTQVDVVQHSGLPEFEKLIVATQVR
ncbi:hypothetical protein CERZMDRAFT_97735 [Cercospora zeae-maydis SCOH1-5]|uniref:Methyltransferase domain-containing protein n=1 Tax=Cercospora zeae-maydis SCOH1-5 TaxID=717836 RepID=A0A6A6FG95_9PEZI|nr:hypothetical protein CERZMDRAFT_97735 [Cercospora zeae-maydis SCOH1-5]